MSETDPDRPVQMLLDDAVCKAIEEMQAEWCLTAYDVVGVLTTIAARYAHDSILHPGDE